METRINSPDSNIYVGCEGWIYDDWKTLRGGPTIFSPLGTRPAEYLSFYAQIFDTVEINTSFYSLPKLSNFESWYRQAPEHFRFSLKMPRDVTHVDNLSRSSYPLVEELIRRIAVLQNKLGVVLIQLPASFKMTAATVSNLTGFLKFIPRELRFAVEFRSAEWFAPEIFALLAEHNVALCLGQNKFLSREIMLEALTAPSADFAYFRFSGLRDLTKLDRVQRPQDESLDFWAAQIKFLKDKRSFVYFSNLFEGFSPASAMNFRKLLGQASLTPEELNPAPSLF
jgi:uncharacterized protein YecE (DUF72 family)